MKLIIEMDERGRMRVESDQEQIDVAEASFLLDLGKMYIQSEWARKLEEDDGESEPDIAEDS